jgi:phosphoribosylanthranilate isomerase
MRPRVKICGITRIEDARAAVAAGADAIGLIFYPHSARFVAIEQARAIAATVPPFVSIVGLFVDAVPEQVREVLNRVNLSLLQFHGAETPDQCRLYGRPYLKAIRMRDDVDLPAEEKAFGDAVGLLLDSFVSGDAGGSGRAFDWARVPAQRTKPLVLAGGLTPENVREAVRRVRPDAVDVCSGVEVTKGIKDPNKITAFIQAARETP